MPKPTTTMSKVSVSAGSVETSTVSGMVRPERWLVMTPE
jgi:hypothetical protein